MTKHIPLRIELALHCLGDAAERKSCKPSSFTELITAYLEHSSPPVPLSLRCRIPFACSSTCSRGHDRRHLFLLSRIPTNETMNIEHAPRGPEIAKSLRTTLELVSTHPDTTIRQLNLRLLSLSLSLSSEYRNGNVVEAHHGRVSSHPVTGYRASQGGCQTVAVLKALVLPPEQASRNPFGSIIV